MGGNHQLIHLYNLFYKNCICLHAGSTQRNSSIKRQDTSLQRKKSEILIDILNINDKMFNCRSPNADTPFVPQEQDVEGAGGEAAASNARRRRGAGFHGLAGRAPRALPRRPRPPASAARRHATCQRC